MPRFTGLLALIATLSLACSSETETETETETGPGGTGSETGDATETGGDGDGDGDGDGEPGECFDIVSDFEQIVGLDCGVPQPCATVEFQTADLCETSPTYDPSAAACIVDALVAGTPARHVIRDCPGGQFSEIWTLQVLEGGTVLWLDSEFQDSPAGGRMTWRALPDPSTFADCELDTPAGLLTCLEPILAGDCQLGTPPCR